MSSEKTRSFSNLVRTGITLREREDGQSHRWKDAGVLLTGLAAVYFSNNPQIDVIGTLAAGSEGVTGLELTRVVGATKDAIRAKIIGIRR